MAVTADQVRAEDVLRRSHSAGVLAQRGPGPGNAGLRVAVVGSRNPTDEQGAMAHALGRELVRLGARVTSGGALGVDTAALQGALDELALLRETPEIAPEMTPLPPLAILPGSVIKPYPPKNAPLFDAIVAAGGTLLSLVKTDDGHVRGRFLARNELLCALVDAVIVVCGDRKSGTMHCARQAWRRDVPVLAVPWSVGVRKGEASHVLLAAGARAVMPGGLLAGLVTSLQAGPQTLLQRELALVVQPLPRTPAGPLPTQKIDGSPTAWPCYVSRAAPQPFVHADPPGLDPGLVARLRTVLTHAGQAGATVDEVAAATGIDRAQVASTLLAWTLHGGVSRTHGSWYALDEAK